jgi:hypothetical protein
MPAPVIRAGTCFALYGFEVAHAIDLDLAERVLAGPERVRIKARRRAPGYFEYRPAPLRVTVQTEPLEVGAWRTAATAELVVYDFGAVSVGFSIPLAGPLDKLPALAERLSGTRRWSPRRAVDQPSPPRRRRDAPRPRRGGGLRHLPGGRVRRRAQRRLAAVRGLVGGCCAPRTAALGAGGVGGPLHLSFGPGDVAVSRPTPRSCTTRPTTCAPCSSSPTSSCSRCALDRTGRDARRAYEHLARQRGPRLSPVELRRLARLQLDAAVLFEQVSNALKLIGDQYLVRVYGMAGQRFHLAEWDASISRKLQTLESIYQKVTDGAAARRMELVEWIIVALIAVELLLPLFKK